MVKRIIFDLDNTLIMWNDSYTIYIKELLTKYGINYDYMEVDKIIDYYEETYSTANKELLLREINTKCNLNLDINFINELLELQKQAAFYNPMLVNLMTYLSSKYELVLLTNWFTDTQVGRLKVTGIDTYFKEFYGGDKVKKRKPNLEAFKMACNNIDPKECLMVGDSLRYDINPALSLGMQVILLDNNYEIKDKKNYPVINDIEQLKELL